MSNNSEGWRVTAFCRPKYSFGHNLRLEEYVENQKHIDPTREHGVFLHLGDERAAYEVVFGESIKKYNEKQKRKDRRIKDYYQKILDNERSGTHKNPKANSDRKPFYEFQFYIGNRDSHCPDEKARKILSLYIQKILPKKFPNFIPTSVTMHNDEYSYDRNGKRIESPAHFHVVGIFVAHALNSEELKEENDYREKYKESKKKELAAKGIQWNEQEWKKKDWRKGMIDRWGKALEKGMELQCSMSAACNEMGFFTAKGNGTAQQQFEEAVRTDLMDFCESMGVKINRTKCYSHSHKEKEVYKAEQDNLDFEAELKEKQELLDAKEIALENRKDDFDYTIEYLEDIKQELSERGADLVLKEEQIKKDSDELDKRTKKLDEKERFISQRECSLKLENERLKEQKRKITIEDYKNQQRADSLTKREEQMNILEEKHDQREQKLLEGELPYLVREKNISRLEDELAERESQFLKREKEYLEKEKCFAEREEQMSVRGALLKQDLEENRRLKYEAVNERKKSESIRQATIDEAVRYSAFNTEKIIEIENWKEAGSEIEESDSWMKTAFQNYNKNRNADNALGKLYGLVKTKVAGAIAKVKKAYDEKLKGMNERLFGKERFSVRRDGRIEVFYSYGAEQYREMFFETPVDNIAKAINECKQNGKKTFAEMCPEGNLSFIEKHFDKAKELTKERNLRLKRFMERQRTMGYS